MKRHLLILIATTGALLGACDEGSSPNPESVAPADADTGEATTTTADAGPAPSEWDLLLDDRELDYGQALRTAALKLVGDLPTLGEIKFVTEAADPEAAYASMIDSYLADPRFAVQMRDYFRDTFRIGGDADADSAPNFAAQLVVEDRSYLELLTAQADTCPTFDEATATFTPGSCTSGAPVTAGVLTNPHVMRQFFSNMAFRRVRWVQETFACAKFPAEVAQELGTSAGYTGVWPFESVGSPATGGTVNFLDTSAIVCANCHTTINHQAPLFAHFDEQGMWQPSFAVPTPAEGAPMVTLADYLVGGETTAWRLGAPAEDLLTFGQAMAEDAEVAECAVVRVWNWAMGKGDVVGAQAIVPPSVIASQTVAFVESGHQLKQAIRAVFTSDDFVRF